MLLLASVGCSYTCDSFNDDVAVAHEECELGQPPADTSCAEDSAELYDCYADCYEVASCEEIAAVDGEGGVDLRECFGFCDQTTP